MKICMVQQRTASCSFLQASSQVGKTTRTLGLHVRAACGGGCGVHGGLRASHCTLRRSERHDCVTTMWGWLCGTMVPEKGCAPSSRICHAAVGDRCANDLNAPVCCSDL